MLKHGLIAFTMSLALASATHAQTYRDSAGTLAPGFVPLVGCANAGNCAGPASPSNPVPVAPQPAFEGSTGRDFSANRPALPNVGANFGGSGPYANYVLIAAAPASASRFSIDIENTSGAQIAIVVDDGTAAAGSSPANASLIVLSGGASIGAQGGSWVSGVEKGRVQVYAPSASAQVTIRQN
jgi:hypothetical protein